MRISVISFLAIVFLFAFTLNLLGQSEDLVLYTFTNETTEPEFVHFNINASEFQISSGSVGFGSSQEGTWGGSGVPYAEGTGGWSAETSDDAKYFYLTLEGEDEATFNITNISFQYRATGAGPSAMTVTINGDDIHSIDVIENETLDFNLDISGYENLSDAEIKIKGWDNGSRETSGGGAFRVNDVLVEGTFEDVDGPVITHTPLDDNESTDNRTATATITGNALVTENDNRPVLHYRVDGGSWNHTYYDSQIGDEFSFVIPGQPENSIVEYYLAATDADAVTTNPTGGSGQNPPGSTPPDNFHSYTILETDDPDNDVVSLTQIGEAYTDNFIGFLGEDDPQYWFTYDDDGVAESEWLGTDAGTSTGGGKYSYGDTGDGETFDGSLGFLPTSTRAIYAEITFINNTGETIEQLDISYDAEHWRSASGGRNNGWTVYLVVNDIENEITDLQFIAPNDLPGGAVDEGDRVHPRSASVGGLNIPDGEMFTIRYFGDNGDGTGSRQGVAIDNFSVTPHDDDEVPPVGDGPEIIHTPLDDTESTDDRTVTAAITGNDLVTESNNRPALHYRVDGGNWSHTYYESRDENEFSFVIPGQSVNSTVEYYLAAKDADDVTTSPAGGSGENPPGSTPPENFHSYEILETAPDPEGIVITLSADPEDTSEENRVQFPYAGMGNEEGDIEHFSEDDWTYIDPQFTFYAVAEGDDEIIAAEFYFEWDHTLGTLDIEEGNFFENENSVFEVIEVDDGKLRINASSLQGNVMPFDGSHFAEITVTVTQPGFHQLAISDVDLRYYDAASDTQIEVPSVSHPGEIKFYLGDFGREDNDSFVGDRGDGEIDFTDLMLFSEAYWSVRGEDDEYRTKYDIGPTDEGGSYFAMPSSDGVIDFEDLVIFSIGYYKSADGELQKQIIEPLRIVVHAIEERGNSVIVPLGFEGVVDDVRAISLELGYPESALSFIGANAAGELDQEMGFYASRELTGRVQLDAAIIRDAFSQEGVFAYLHFDRNNSFDPGSIGFISAIARNSTNSDIPVEFSGFADDRDAQRPVTFNLSQNYPNPFNPVTTIEYQLPEDVHVSIVVYNVLGEKVAELIHEYQESGYHSVAWDGTTMNNIPAPSGMYIYRMQAGDYTKTKRMTLLK